MFDLPNLTSALVGLGARPPSPDLFERLREAHEDPMRHYHTGIHIADGLRRLRLHAPLAQSPWEVETALWFHDAVYDPRCADNEERSAAWARRELESLGTQAGKVGRIVAMILATKTHISADPDTQLLLDVDLAILGSGTEEFEEYDRAIRKEYAWVPEPEYRTGRTRVLSSFLERPRIYGTPALRDLLELRARENLGRKVAELSGGGSDRDRKQDKFPAAHVPRPARTPPGLRDA